MSNIAGLLTDPRLRTFRGWDPESKTLRGPIICIGNCLEPIMTAGTVAFVDTSIECIPGDFVEIQMPSGRTMIKRLELIGAQKILTATHTPPIALTDEMRVLGVVVAIGHLGYDPYPELTAEADKETAAIMEKYKAMLAGDVSTGLQVIKVQQ